MIWTVRHEMTLEVSPEAHIWSCPECGRREQVWPEFKLLVRGDEQAAHFGSAGGLNVTQIVVEEKKI